MSFATRILRLYTVAIIDNFMRRLDITAPLRLGCLWGSLRQARQDRQDESRWETLQLPQQVPAESFGAPMSCLVESVKSAGTFERNIVEFVYCCCYIVVGILLRREKCLWIKTFGIVLLFGLVAKGVDLPAWQEPPFRDKSLIKATKVVVKRVVELYGFAKMIYD